VDKKIHALFERVTSTPFPKLGKVVGDFALYDSLLAGAVSSFLAGLRIDAEAVPVPDDETAAALPALEQKGTHSAEEMQFLNCARLLGELREETIKAIRRG